MPSSSFSRRNFLKSFAAASAAATLSPLAFGQASARAAAASGGREQKTELLIVGASLGGVAAAITALQMGRSVILTEETRWIGGQATTQGVPMDEHPWVEDFGSTKRYREFRTRIRDYYRRNYPLTAKARADKYLNPGAGWVSAIGFEPRVGMAVLYEMLLPYLSSGKLTLWLQHRPVAVAMDGDRCRAVTLHDDDRGLQRTVSAPIILDATELGELIELGKIESVIGAESRAQTGEPNALDGAANPKDQMGFTHLIAMDYLPGEEHVIAKPRDYELYKNLKNTAGNSKLFVADLFGVERDFYGKTPSPGRYVCSPWNFRRSLCKNNFESGAFPSDLTVPIWSQNEYHQGVLCGVSAEERKKHMEGGRQLTLSLLYWLQTEAPNPRGNGKGFPGLRPRGDFFGTEDGLAQYPYIRESTRIKAEFTVLEQHFRTDVAGQENGPKKYADSIGLSGYRIDIHKPAKQGGKGSMTEALHGKHWCQQIPLGAFIPQRVENLVPACKNLGVTAVTNGSFRIHSGEWNIGESAGAFAAYCVAKNLAPRQVRNTPAHLADFQRELTKQGVELDWPRPLTSRSYFSHHDVEIKDRETFYFGDTSLLT